MKNSKRNSLIAAYLLLSSCTTSSYQLVHDDRGRAGIIATGDRIVLTCEDVQDPEEKSPSKHGRYGFTVLVLDNQNTYSTFVQLNIITKKTCLERLEKFEKMKLRAKRFYIAGFGASYDKPGDERLEHFFPGRGKVMESGWGVSFSVLKSDDNECITKVFGDTKPCNEELLEHFPEAGEVFKN